VLLLWFLLSLLFFHRSVTRAHDNNNNETNKKWDLSARSFRHDRIGSEKRSEAKKKIDVTREKKLTQRGWFSFLADRRCKTPSAAFGSSVFSSSSTGKKDT